MNLSIELVFFVPGLWVFVTAKLPSILLGSRQYKYEGPGVRLIGVALMIPMLVALVGHAVLGNDASGLIILQLASILGACIAAIFISQRIRQPRDEAED